MFNALVDNPVVFVAFVDIGIATDVVIGTVVVLIVSGVFVVVGGGVDILVLVVVAENRFKCLV